MEALYPLLDPVVLRGNHFLACRINEADLTAEFHFGEAFVEVSYSVVLQGNHDLACLINEAPLIVEFDSGEAFGKVPDILVLCECDGLYFEPAQGTLDDLDYLCGHRPL